MEKLEDNRMIRTTTLSLLVWFLYSAQAASSPPRSIELRDGTRISGQVVSMRDDSYVIESSSLGRITLLASQILSIGAPASSPTDANRDARQQGEIEAMQKRMVMDSGIMNSIQGLQTDERILEILNDPAIMSAVQNGDLNALYNNPRFMELMNHPGIVSIRDQMLER